MDPTIESALWGTEGLAGLQRVLMSLDIHEALTQSIAAMLGASARLTTCRLHRAKFKPGRKLTTYYDLVIDGDSPSSSTTRAAAVVWRPVAEAAKNEPTTPLAAMQAEATARGLIAPFVRLVGVAPALGAQIQIAPLDEAFPQLVRVSDPEYVPSLVAALKGVQNDQSVAERASGYAISAIRYRPGQRHVLRYEPNDAAPDGQDPRTLFVKLYEDAEETQRAFGVASRVADWLAHYGNGLHALRPLGYNSDDAVIVYPRLVGTPLSSLLDRPLNQVRSYLDHAGAVLRTLHRRPDEIASELAQTSAHATSLLDDLKPHSFSKEIKTIARTCEHIYAFLPAVGDQIDAILKQAQTLYDTLPQEEPTFAHGDYKADHLWITERGLTLMDFDTCYLADPAIDVGKFLSDLQWWSIEYGRDDIAQLRDTFLSSYARDVPPARLQRAQIYEALVLVKSTAHRVRLFESAWSDRTEQLIARAGNIIARAS